MKHSQEVENYQGTIDIGKFLTWLRGQLYRYRGLMAAFGCACLSSIVTILVTVVHGVADASQLVFVRGSVSFIFSMVLLIRLRIQLTPTSRNEVKGLLFQGISSSLVIYSLYYAYQNMPTGDASAIIYGYIAFSVVLGRIFIKEPLGWFEGIMVVLTIIGVVLIIRPPFLFRSQGTEGTTKVLPALSALFSSLSSACITVAFRILGKQDTNPIKTVMYGAIFQVALSSVSITFTSEWDIPGCTWTRLQIFVIGMLAYSTMLSFAYALTIENIALVTVITVNEVYLVFFADTFLLGTPPNLFSIGGIIMIVCSSLGISCKKIMQIRKQLKEDKSDVTNDADRKSDVRKHDMEEETTEDENCIEPYQRRDIRIGQESRV